MTLKIDLHTHTANSADSRQNIPDMIKQALRVGINGFAVCDHDKLLDQTVFHHIKVRAEKEFNISINPEQGSDDGAAPFYIINGIEITTEIGHVIGLFLDKEVLYKKTDSAKEALRFIKENNGISVLAHPFQHRTKINDVIKILDGYSFDCIEVFNARAAYKNKYANDFAYEILGNLSFTAGSDAHLTKEIGNAYIEFDFDGIPTIDDIRNIILNKKATGNGTNTPPSFIGRSQMIKHVKNKTYHKFLKSFLFYIKSLIKR